jgi:hypothetical protein
MEMVNVKVGEICKEKSEYNSWLLYMLQNYTCLRASCHFLFLADPPSMTQMLIRPVSGGLDALAKDPESFICKLQAQVFEVVLPIWNHPVFMHCDVTLINSIASIITHIYIGVGNVNGSRMPGLVVWDCASSGNLWRSLLFP